MTPEVCLRGQERFSIERIGEMKIRFVAFFVVLSAVMGCSEGGAPAQGGGRADQTPGTAAPPETEKPKFDASRYGSVLDPICLMSLEEYEAVATADHDGKTYGFCSELCKKKFVEAPEKMVARVEAKTKEVAGVE
jgi:YHS domain-containing protein